ncbi:MAG TPA: LysM peptidoglycan-binding domain-containing protein [Eubacteriaceae bacterium]|nr:LysM peptidoglycan-binding domain-containing protein [Eubacteriaceae bacterium]
MNIETIKYIIIYFLIFVLIIGLTSVFIVKEFIEQAREIEIQGEDMLNMQLALNNGTLSEEDSKEQEQENNSEIIIEPNEEDNEDNREVFEIGDSGEKIKEFQEILYKLKYIKSNPDGIFGPVTEKALKKFQKTEGLEETGRLDGETQKALERAIEAENDDREETPDPNNQNSSKVHIVKANENLYSISKKHDVTIADICKVNNISENSILNIGQELIIP